jgi:hypothetical protein
LCEPHHRAKTEARLTIDRAWLDDDQVTWLAAVGWIVFHEDDDPTGRGWRHFTAGGTA